MALTTTVNKFKKFLYANIENVIFSLCTTFTGCALFLCAIYTFFLLFSGDFMSCAIPPDDSTHGELAPSSVSKFCFNARTPTTRPPGNTTQNNDDDKEIIKHNLYIWTPYILVVQAFLFYFPQYILLHAEGDTFKRAMVSFTKLKTPSREKREDRYMRAYGEFMDRLLARNHCALGPILCEVTNVVFITFQIYVMKLYLGTKFYEDTYSGNSFDVVFPKSLQCALHVAERNGTHGNNVTTCDMPINYANEIIYTYLWTFANLMMGLATMVILFRLLSMHLYCRCNAFNRFEFERVCTGPVKQGSLMIVTIWGFSRWLTIRRLAGELTGEEFSLLVDIMDREVDNESSYEMSDMELFPI